MIKVLMERTIKGQQVKEIVRLLRMLRVKAMQQPGFITGETLHAIDDPNHYLVIGSWEKLEDWEAWFNNPERKELQADVDKFLEEPTKIRVYTY
jgi:heme oxygenase (mycobilin-producing)